MCPPMPIIGGFPRSGTTLLRLMLDAHADLAIPAETHFLPAVRGLAGEAGDLREKLFTTITQFPTWDDFALPREAFREALTALPSFTVADGVRAFYRLYAARLGKSRWGDKSPPSCLHTPAIQELLPEAHFIHILRDGRDAALSVKDLWFAPGKDLETLARSWCGQVQTARALGRQCRHYCEVRYEDLIADPAGTLQRLCRFVELPYQPRMLRYYEHARARLDEVRTRYRGDGTVLITKEERLFNQRLTSVPPDRSRVYRWKTAMTKEMRGQFEDVARELLHELGYETDAHGAPQQARAG